jgi:DNA excision repair protein ERCC-6
MGFERQQARSALRRSGHDLMAACARLLDSTTRSTPGFPSVSDTSSGVSNNAQGKRNKVETFVKSDESDETPPSRAVRKRSRRSSKNDRSTSSIDKDDDDDDLVMKVGTQSSARANVSTSEESEEFTKPRRRPTARQADTDFQPEHGTNDELAEEFQAFDEEPLDDEFRDNEDEAEHIHDVDDHENDQPIACHFNPDDKTVPDVEFEGSFKIPGSIWKDLLEYQRTGVKWMWELHCQEAGGLIGDDMGLGKTVQVCSFLGSLHYSGLITGPTIILCPATLMRHWEREMKSW